MLTVFVGGEQNDLIPDINVQLDRYLTGIGSDISSEFPELDLVDDDLGRFDRARLLLLPMIIRRPFAKGPLFNPLPLPYRSHGFT